MVLLSELMASEGVVLDPEVERELRREHERLQTTQDPIDFNTWVKQRMKSTLVKGGGGVKPIASSIRNSGSSSSARPKARAQLGFGAPTAPKYNADRYVEREPAHTSATTAKPTGILRVRPANQLAFTTGPPRAPALANFQPKYFKPDTPASGPSAAPAAQAEVGAAPLTVDGEGRAPESAPAQQPRTASTGAARGAQTAGEPKAEVDALFAPPTSYIGAGEERGEGRTGAAPPRVAWDEGTAAGAQRSLQTAQKVGSTSSRLAQAQALARKDVVSAPPKKAEGGPAAPDTGRPQTQTQTLSQREYAQLTESQRRLHVQNQELQVQLLQQGQMMERIMQGMTLSQSVLKGMLGSQSTSPAPANVADTSTAGQPAQRPPTQGGAGVMGMAKKLPKAAAAGKGEKKPEWNSGGPGAGQPARVHSGKDGRLPGKETAKVAARRQQQEVTTTAVSALMEAAEAERAGLGGRDHIQHALDNLARAQAEAELGLPPGALHSAAHEGPRSAAARAATAEAAHKTRNVPRAAPKPAPDSAQSARQRTKPQWDSSSDVSPRPQAFAAGSARAQHASSSERRRQPTNSTTSRRAGARSPPRSYSAPRRPFMSTAGKGRYGSAAVQGASHRDRPRPSPGEGRDDLPSDDLDQDGSGGLTGSEAGSPGVLEAAARALERELAEQVQQERGRGWHGPEPLRASNDRTSHLGGYAADRSSVEGPPDHRRGGHTGEASQGGARRGAEAGQGPEGGVGQEARLEEMLATLEARMTATLERAEQRIYNALDRSEAPDAAPAAPPLGAADSSAQGEASAGGRGAEEPAALAPESLQAFQKLQEMESLEAQLRAKWGLDQVGGREQYSQQQKPVVVGGPLPAATPPPRRAVELPGTAATGGRAPTSTWRQDGGGRGAAQPPRGALEGLEGSAGASAAARAAAVAIATMADLQEQRWGPSQAGPGEGSAAGGGEVPPRAGPSPGPPAGDTGPAAAPPPVKGSGVSDAMLHRIVASRDRFVRRQTAMDGALVSAGSSGDDPYQQFNLVEVVERVGERLLADLVDEEAEDALRMCDTFVDQVVEAEFLSA